MLKCPKCKTQLNGIDLRAGECPHCGSDLAGTQTMDVPDATGAHDATIDYTGDSTHASSFPEPADTMVPEPADTMDVPATSASADADGPSQSDDTSLDESGPLETLNGVGAHSADAADGPAPTLETALPPSDSARLRDRVQATWASAAVGDSRSNMTIKTVGEASASSQSSLVIQSRAISQPGEGASKGPADYDLLDLLGEGGMGVVYTARQASIDRTVAVKMLKPKMEGDEFQKQKFLSEAVVTGELDHPNIVPIYDLGRNADGALFYSMKKIQGTPWMDVIQQKSLIENLQILLKVADAVAFSHSRGVIHRDLKPENVMLGEFGEVLLLDWGLAITLPDCEKSANMPKQAGMGGTPAYMAPEMAAGPVEAIGKHSDVYLLGAILYECVTGKRPHAGKSAMRCILAAARNEIVPIEKSGELVDVALKAMETEPANRYATVQDFQRAVRDYLEHSESIALSSRAAAELVAAKQSDDYRDYAKSLFVFEEAYDLWKGNGQAKTGIADAQQAYASSALRKGDFDLGLTIVTADDPRHRELAARLKKGQTERDARQQRLKNAKRAVAALLALVFVAITVGFLLVNKWRAIAVANERVAKQNAVEAEENAQRAERNAERAKANEILALANEQEALQQQAAAVSARDEAEYEAYLASIGLAASKIRENALGQARESLENCDVKLRNWEWRRLRHQCQQGTELPVGGKLFGLAINDNGSRVVTAGQDNKVRVFDRESGELVCEPLTIPAAQTPKAVAFSPIDDAIVAIGISGSDGNLMVWNTSTAETRVFAGHVDSVNDVLFGKSGARLLTASDDETARIWNLDSGQVVQVLKGHSGNVLSAEFSADEQQVVTASRDKTVRVWDARTGQQRRVDDKPTPFRGHQEPVMSASFSPDGQHVVSAGSDKRVLIWRPDHLMPFDYQGLVEDGSVDELPYIALDGHTATVSQVQFSSDANQLLSASHDNSVKIWKLTYSDDSRITKASLLKTLRGHDSVVTHAWFAESDPDQVVSSSFDGTVRSWSIADYEENRIIPDTVLSGYHDGAVLRAEFSPRGDRIVTASRDHTAKSWATAGGPPIGDFREGHLYLTLQVAFYPEGSNRLLTSAVDGTVRVWNLKTGTQLFEIGQTGYSAAATLSTDGKWILTSSAQEAANDQSTNVVWPAKLWSGSDGQLIRSFQQHTAQVSCVAISPDKRFIFTGDTSGNGNLWNAHTGQLIATVRRHTRRITAAVFHHDSGRLTTGSEDRAVFHWKLADLDLAASAPIKLAADASLKAGHPKSVTALALTPDGKHLLTGCADGVARYWRMDDGEPLWTWKAETDGKISSVAISPDAAQAVVLDSVHNVLGRIDLRTGQEIGDDHFLRLNSKRALGYAVAYSPDGTGIATVGGDEACLWDMDGKELLRFGPHHTVSFASYSYPDAKYIVTAGWDNSAKIWDTESQRSILKLTAQRSSSQQARVNSAVFSPIDASRVLTAHADSLVRIWQCDAENQTAKVALTLTGHDDEVVHAVYSPDGRHIVSSSLDKTARVWEAASGELIATLNGHSAPVRQAAFSSDGTLVVTGSNDFTICVWRVDSGELLSTLQGHTAAVNSVALSPDNTRILSGSADRSVKLWDASTFREILTLNGHLREVTSVAFSSDGSQTKYALSASRDGTAIVWLAIPSDQGDDQIAVRE